MRKNKKTLILGATPNPDRYAYKAAIRLSHAGYPIVLVGLKKGIVAGVDIQSNLTVYDDVHTVTVYLSPQNQQMYYKYILDLNPERVIFNPGTENPEFYTLLEASGVEVLEACTLVMLASLEY